MVTILHAMVPSWSQGSHNTRFLLYLVRKSSYAQSLSTWRMPRDYLFEHRWVIKHVWGLLSITSVAYPMKTRELVEWQTMRNFYGGNPQYRDWPSSAIHHEFTTKEGGKMPFLPSLRAHVWFSRHISIIFFFKVAFISFVDSWRVSRRLL